jgi:hypothetical protein
MMFAHRLAFAAAALLLCGGFVGMEQAVGARQGPEPAAAAAAAPPSADSMGVSLKAIRTQLKNAPEEKKPTGGGMRYDFFVDVLGTRPPIDFFRDFDLSTKGSVRWGTPTHQEILSAMSPYWVNAMRAAGTGVDLLAVGRKK